TKKRDYKRSDTRKPEIINHLYQVLSQEGLQGTTLSKVAEHLGIATSVLLHHFKTKDDMFIELAKYVYNNYEKKYLALSAEKHPPKKCLESFLNVAFDQVWDETDESVYWALFYLGSRIKEIREREKLLTLRMKDYISDQIKKIQKTNEQLDHDPEAIAYLVIAMESGLDMLGASVGYDNDKIRIASQIAKKIATDLAK
ncbi:MAG: TetR/AcrR family transcriptional regulator, partial [Desulfobacteraceae bacterium]|nr:TetR/AcrR family transcriptional regulator [Desulfobacteraceae bacterium]